MYASTGGTGGRLHKELSGLNNAAGSEQDVEVRQAKAADRSMLEADAALAAVLRKATWQIAALLWIHRGMAVISGAEVQPWTSVRGVVGVSPPMAQRGQADSVATFDYLLKDFVYIAEQLEKFDIVGSRGPRRSKWTPSLVRAIALFYVGRASKLCSGTVREALESSTLLYCDEDGTPFRTGSW